MMVVAILFAITMSIGKVAEAKQVREYLGEWYITSYSASDNTPRGTHATATGAYATAGWTCAVDMHNPLAPMGSIIEIEGLGVRKVQDRGNFGYCNGGRRAIDVFIGDSEQGFLLERKIWLIRQETKAEKKAREKKEQTKKRKKLQKKPFKLVYNPCLSPWQIVTDKDIISGGTCIVEWDAIMPFAYLDVVTTKKGIGNTIYIGDREKVEQYRKISFSDIIEEAVG